MGSIPFIAWVRIYSGFFCCISRIFISFLPPKYCEWRTYIFWSSLRPVTLILSACVTPPPIEEFTFDWSKENPFNGYELTIVTPYGRWLRVFATSYMTANPGTRVRIIELRDIERGREQINMQLMAASAPILICTAFVDHFNPLISDVYIADWLPVIYSDPRFNEENYFMNVINASKIDDKLLSFPVTFMYDLIATNNDIPGMAEAGSELNSISRANMLALQNQFAADAQLYLEAHVGFSSRISRMIPNEFFDFNAGLVNFNNQDFINYLIQSEAGTNPRGFHPNSFTSMTMITPAEEAGLAQEYLFLRTSLSYPQHFPIIERTGFFTTAQPYVNHDGKLIISTFGNSYVLNSDTSNTERAMAWDFINFITTASNDPNIAFHFYLGRQYVSRDLARRNVVPWRTSVRELDTNGWQLTADLDDSLDIIANQMQIFGEMPMVYFRREPMVINDIYFEITDQFSQGLITAEQASQDLQNRITLVMLEMGFATN